MFYKFRYAELVANALVWRTKLSKWKFAKNTKWKIVFYGFHSVHNQVCGSYQADTAELRGNFVYRAQRLLDLSQKTLEVPALNSKAHPDFRPNRLVKMAMNVLRRRRTTQLYKYKGAFLIVLPSLISKCPVVDCFLSLIYIGQEINTQNKAVNPVADQGTCVSAAAN